MSLPERETTLEKFKNDPTYRVMLISMVGGVGLNLTIAKTVVIFVSPQIDANAGLTRDA
jgi:SNF2 family DNA or RNA helicase